MYHRIADEPIDSGLAVSPAHFQEQLHILRRTRHPLPLANFVHRLVAGTLPRNAVAVTFDDGYVDNLMAGKPRLMAADVPATVFLTTGYIDRAEAWFWWDELARLILIEKWPQGFELAIGAHYLRFDLAAESAVCEDGATSPASPASLTKRQAALSTLREALRPLEDKERRLIMAHIRSVFAASDYRANLCRAMTSDEVQALVRDGLVTVGAHTVTHPVLTTLKTAACRREIIESKLTCEALVGTPVTSFAYPYGDFNATVCDEVRTAGFALACSVRSGPVSIMSDVFVLPRVFVPNWDGDEFERALRSASTVH